MKKVLLIQGTIPEYRVPVFNELAKHVDLTVVYSYGKVSEDAAFRHICIPTRTLRYKIHTENLYALANKNDVVICMFDFSYIFFRLLYLLPHKYKLIFWGIGVSASYDCRYDQDQRYVRGNLRVMKKADAMLFYASYPVEKYSKLGISREKLFVANNTTLVKPQAPAKKDQILFVGALYKQKRIEALLDAYLAAYHVLPDIYNMTIIGDGDEKDNVESWIHENGLEKKVKLTGAIYDEDLLAQHFAKGIVCISPDQAGLSVLKSMGHGVPFITHKRAITGGEIFNIVHGENGILLDNFEQIKDVILDCSQHPEKYIEMGKNAQEYYVRERTVPHMVQGFLDAIEYVLK